MWVTGWLVHSWLGEGECVFVSVLIRTGLDVKMCSVETSHMLMLLSVWITLKAFLPLGGSIIFHEHTSCIWEHARDMGHGNMSLKREGWNRLHLQHITAGWFLSSSLTDYHLCQGSYMTGLVCLFVCRVTQKVMDRFALKCYRWYVWAMVTGDQNFGRDPWDLDSGFFFGKILQLQDTVWQYLTYWVISSQIKWQSTHPVSYWFVKCCFEAAGLVFWPVTCMSGFGWELVHCIGRYQLRLFLYTDAVSIQIQWFNILNKNRFWWVQQRKTIMVLGRLDKTYIQIH